MKLFNSVSIILIIVLFFVIIGNTVGFHVPYHREVLNQTSHTCGFLGGLWHGFISPITFVIGWFNHSVDVWEVNNNGGWYTFGFLLSVCNLTSIFTRSSSSNN